MDSNNRYTLLNISELDDEPDVEWLIDGVIPQGEPVVIYGDGGQYKSLVLLNICFNVQGGRPVAGIPTKKSRIIWFALEGWRDLKARKEGHFHCYGQCESTEIWFVRKEAFSFGNSQNFGSMYRTIKEYEIDVVVVDTLSMATEGDLSSSNISGQVTREMRRFCDELGVTFILVAHTGKLIKSGIKGGSEFSNNVPCVIFINQGVLSVEKQRSAPSGFKQKFHIENVDPKNKKSPPYIVWDTDEDVIQEKYLFLFEYYDELARQGDVTKKMLKDASHEMFPTRTKDTHRTQFNRDWDWATETGHFEECFGGIIKRNTSETSETIQSVSADSLNSNTLEES
ncbi:AAA family ATPase [Gammaproteobacteria bacterium]|nr:AAA family ATPase [Gammaproteobacteria bacterium]